MIKNILTLAVLAIIGWVIYATFYGKPEDIQLRNNLLNKSKELGQAVTDIFKSETKKVKSGEYEQVFGKLDSEQYRDKKIVVKGCSEKPVPAAAYMELTRILRPLAQSIMFGEPCSTVPLYKKEKKKEEN
jgi:hypothetical protein